MKRFSYALTVLLTVNLGLAIAQPSRVLIDGTWYTNGQTAYIECGKSSVNIDIDPVTDGSGLIPIGVNTSSNFSTATTVSDIEDILYLDSSHQNGWIEVYWGGNYSLGSIIVYVQQKPPTPTFTSTSSLCSTGNSATFSVSDA
ncbi:hypothetical protein, partial [Spirosoma gilvum]